MGHRPAAVCYTSYGAGLAPFMSCNEDNERKHFCRERSAGQGCTRMCVAACARCHTSLAGSTHRIPVSAPPWSYTARSSSLASQALLAFLALPEYTANKRQWSGRNLNEQLKIKVFHEMLTRQLSSLHLLKVSLFDCGISPSKKLPSTLLQITPT